MKNESPRQSKSIYLESCICRYIPPHRPQALEQKYFSEMWLIIFIWGNDSIDDYTKKYIKLHYWKKKVMQFYNKCSRIFVLYLFYLSSFVQFIHLTFW